VASRLKWAGVPTQRTGSADGSSSNNSSNSSSNSQTNGNSDNQGNGNANGNNNDMSNMFQSLASNPQVAALRNDPQMQPMFEDIQRNGQSAIFKYLNDPAVMAKAASVMGAMFNGGGQPPAS